MPVPPRHRLVVPRGHGTRCHHLRGVPLPDPIPWWALRGTVPSGRAVGPGPSPSSGCLGRPSLQRGVDGIATHSAVNQLSFVPQPTLHQARPLRTVPSWD